MTDETRFAYKVVGKDRRYGSNLSCFLACHPADPEGTLRRLRARFGSRFNEFFPKYLDGATVTNPRGLFVFDKEHNAREFLLSIAPFSLKKQLEIIPVEIIQPAPIPERILTEEDCILNPRILLQQRGKLSLERPRYGTLCAHELRVLPKEVL